MGETARRLPLRCGRRASISCFCCRLIRRLAAIAGCSREPTGTVRRPLVLLRPRAQELHCELLGPCVGWAAARPPHDRADTESNTKTFSHLDSSRGGDECKRDPPKGYNTGTPAAKPELRGLCVRPCKLARMARGKAVGLGRQSTSPRGRPIQWWRSSETLDRA